MIANIVLIMQNVSINRVPNFNDEIIAKENIIKIIIFRVKSFIHEYFYYAFGRIGEFR